MGTTLARISELMTNSGFKHRVEEERSVIISGFGTKNYRDRDGDKHQQVVIAVNEDGEYIRFMTPYAYKCLPTDPHLCAVLSVLLKLNYETKLLTYEWDGGCTGDGEIRAAVNLCLEDQVCSPALFNRALRGLLELTEKHYYRIHTAFETGQVLDRKAAEIAVLREQLTQLEQDSDGTAEAEDGNDGTSDEPAPTEPIGIVE